MIWILAAWLLIAALVRWSVRFTMVDGPASQNQHTALALLWPVVTVFLLWKVVSGKAHFTRGQP